MSKNSIIKSLSCNTHRPSKLSKQILEPDINIILIYINLSKNNIEIIHIWGHNTVLHSYWTHGEIYLRNVALDRVIKLSKNRTYFQLEETNFHKNQSKYCGPGTHWNSACFSEKTRTQKSPSWLGSKVDGKMRYSPGGRQKREQTSRRLVKVSERAAEACRAKKLRSRWKFLCPTNYSRIPQQN